MHRRYMLTAYPALVLGIPWHRASYGCAHLKAEARLTVISRPLRHGGRRFNQRVPSKVTNPSWLIVMIIIAS